MQILGFPEYLYAAQPGYQAIEWADASFYIRWIVPQLGNEAAQDFDIKRNPQARAAAEAARDSRHPVLTRPLKLVQGGTGWVAYVPVFRGGQFDGLMGDVTNMVKALIYTTRPNSYRLMKMPMTISCNCVDFEKQMVFRARRLRRVRKAKCLRSIRWVLRFPGWCFSGSR